MQWTLILFVLGCREVAQSFAPNRKRHLPISRTTPTESILVSWASRSARGNNGPSKKGKNANSSSAASAAKKSNKTKKSAPSKSVTSRAAKLNKKTSQSSQHVAPPWQIVSKKDMAKNVKAEKERRKLAQQGVHNVKEDIEYSISKSFLSNEDKALLAWKRFAQAPQDEIEFLGAYLNQHLPPKIGAPEVAFLGRSNVGKSSLLNKLVGSEKARVGKTPGATASVNLYGIFRKEKAILGLVDLPGFGYAKLSKENKESVQAAAENYLGKRKELMLGILLVDIRREPSDDDHAVLAALFDMGVPIVVVATKIDKLSKNQLDGQLQSIREGLGLPEGQPFTVSSVTGQGIKELWRIIMEGCETGVEELKGKVEDGRGDEEAPVPIEDGEDVVYDQGFDWIHDSYKADENWEENDDADFGTDEGADVNIRDADMVNQRESLKYLREKAKDMEKKGLL